MEATITHLLHINASPRGDSSQSRTISNELVEAMKIADPSIAVTDRDLGHQVIPFVTEPFIYAMYTPEENQTAEQKELLKFSDELIAELFAADIYVFGIPMYNFGVPAVFKAWIDYVARANKTFNPATYEGLLKNKKAIVVSAHGGSGYGPGQERESYNQLVPTLRGILGFMGVTEVEFVSVEGTSGPAEKLEPVLAKAREQIAKLAKG